jgi:two-component system, OmpR family, catabolic regulation response regulator CreB
MLPKILLIDDDPVICRDVCDGLSKDGFEPIACGTGGEGLARAELEAPDLILLDINLPDISGYDLFRMLRHRLKPWIPIIFLTSRSEEMERVAGLECGADDYIPKPFYIREVGARIRSVLRRTESTDGRFRGDLPTKDGFAIDSVRKFIRYQGEVLDLSISEYRILEALLEHPGHVLTRTQLVDRICGYEDPTDERNIDSHIKRIRIKLRALDPSQDQIQTLRGFGYALRVEP